MDHGHQNISLILLAAKVRISGEPVELFRIFQPCGSQLGLFASPPHPPGTMDNGAFLIATTWGKEVLLASSW